jgi:hypothetical protein
VIDLRRTRLALAVALDIVFVIGLAQGWLPAESKGLRGFLIVLGVAMPAFVLVSLLSKSED